MDGGREVKTKMEVDIRREITSIEDDLSLIEQSTRNVAENIDKLDPFLRPFAFGWKREVVMRVITDSRRPNCDIYYFHPNGKKLRSLSEVKAHLTDGLTADCFTFQKSPLHVVDESIRHARIRAKKTHKHLTALKVVQNKTKHKANEVKNDKPQPTKKKLESKRQSMIRKKENLKAHMNAKRTKQNKIVPDKKSSLKSAKKDKTQGHKVLKANNNNRKTASNVKENEKAKKTGKEKTDEKNSGNAQTSKLTSQDIKSIVQKNIGKYREMRQKQMLGSLKDFLKKTKGTQKSKEKQQKLKPEPISSMLDVYLKPLEKGWRRELVHRVNGSAAQGLSDVYYFHPNGKKLRSTREVSENLTPGLSVESFTFRKEALGCGEPLEVIRNARVNQTLYKKK